MLDTVDTSWWLLAGVTLDAQVAVVNLEASLG